MKKKIGILTEHNSINYGSVLQTNALFNILSERHEVYILNYRLLKNQIKEFKDFFLKFNLKKIIDAKNLYTKIKDFNLKIKYEPKKILYSNNNLEDYYFDKIVVGSDEMWNFNNPYRGKDLTFFGKKWNCGEKISYATSFGSTENLGELKEKVTQLLNDFNYISVRDFHSENLLKSIGINSKIVLDPTYIYDYKLFKKDEYKNHVFVYGYFDQKKIEKIIEFCKKNDLKTFSPQPNNIWCDKVIILDPYDWVNYLYSCKYVFTSSFHATIFSIKFRKNFIYFYDFWSFNKVIDILEFLNIKNNYFIDDNSFRFLKEEWSSNEIFKNNIEKLVKNSNEFLHNI